jgi:hypothetical protein
MIFYISKLDSPSISLVKGYRKHKLSAVSLVANDPPQSPLKRGKKTINEFSPLFKGGWGGSKTRNVDRACKGGRR